MKKIVISFILISFQFCYIEWTYNSAFIFQMQWEIIVKAFDKPLELIHPAIILPLLGEILLVIALFQKDPGKKIMIAAISLLGLLVLFIFFIGILASSQKILGSTVPFIAFSAYYLIKGKRPWSS